MDNQQFDFIVTGAGCAGLSLVMHLIRSPKLRNAQILLVDQDAKRTNDRTWCFWEKEAGLFDSIVYKSWEQLWFRSDDFSGKLQIAPYRYKLIRGIDFYTFCLDEIKKLPNIHFLQAPVESIHSKEEETYALIAGQKYRARYIFNSILFDKPVLKPDHYWLLQHFKGWVVETEKETFDPFVATLMDFRVGQEQGTTFVYVLPFSARKALVEYTVFSGSLLPQEAYDGALQQYMKTFLGVDRYTVSEQEFGVIPMTNYPFPQRHNSILNIGTAGGQTKASSGYTFRFIQKQAQRITASLEKGDHPFSGLPSASRFRFYDSVLLHILHHRKLEGAHIFSRLFRRNKPANVFQFLDNETDLAKELRLISSLPQGPFLLAALRHLTQ